MAFDRINHKAVIRLMQNLQWMFYLPNMNQISSQYE